MPDTNSAEPNLTLEQRVQKLEELIRNMNQQLVFSYPPPNTIRWIMYRALAPADNHTVAAVGGTYVMPINGTLIVAGATVDTAGTTGTGIVDLNKNGTTMLATDKVRFDTTEDTSRTAATSAKVTSKLLVIGDKITCDIDTIQTTPAKGLTWFLGVAEA